MGAPAPGTPMLPMPVMRIIHGSSLNCIASLANNNYILVILVWGHLHKGESLVLFMKGLVTYIPAVLHCEHTLVASRGVAGPSS